MTEGSTRPTRLGCTHPMTFRTVDGDGVPVIAPCSWCGPGFVLAESAAVPTIGDGKDGPMETGWHDDATAPYLTALQALRNAACREQDRVQAGSLPGDRLLAVLADVHAARLTYLRAVSAALGAPIPAAEVDAVTLED